jgi:hypothetical protein
LGSPCDDGCSDANYQADPVDDGGVAEQLQKGCLRHGAWRRKES